MLYLLIFLALIVGIPLFIWGSSFPDGHPMRAVIGGIIATLVSGVVFALAAFVALFLSIDPDFHGAVGVVFGLWVAILAVIWGVVIYRSGSWIVEQSQSRKPTFNPRPTARVTEVPRAPEPFRGARAESGPGRTEQAASWDDDLPHAGV